MKVRTMVRMSMLVCLWAAPAGAERLRVPGDHPTIQDAVNAASPGDEIRVGPGSWCGATIDKPLEIAGQGRATIVGCAASPNLFGVLRIGFFLPTAAASGTSIHHFTFDGAGVSNADLDPLAFGVFARDANNVSVQHNVVLGTVQAVTNTRGHGWTISHNEVRGLSVFTCDGFCGGGDAIVLQSRFPTVTRITGNTVSHNVVTGAVPDTLDEFSMVGILAIGTDGALITNNRISIPDNPLAAGNGQGIVITNSCCGAGTVAPTSINSVVVNNDGRGSEFAVVIELETGGGTGNSAGTVLRGNFGVNDINGSASTVTNRSRQTLIVFP
jgi:nitrous oxidase accessory protein NosD